MLVLCSKRLGFNSSQTSIVAQKLYSRGFISYPRTESRAYSKQMANGFGDILHTLKRYEPFKDHCNGLLEQDEWNHDHVNETLNEDHPPITPVIINKNKLRIHQKSDSFKLYDLIVRSFFASLSTDMKYTENVATFSIMNESFTY